METQFGLAHVWHQGDWIIRCVAVILLGMSVLSWITIALKALRLRRHLVQARASDLFWHSHDLDEGLRQLLRGIEKESLRVDGDSRLASTPHPVCLGSPLTHPSITTDFSEAQLELITGVSPSFEPSTFTRGRSASARRTSP